MNLPIMIHAHPYRGAKDGELRARSMEACAHCALICTMCADACLSEPQVDALRECISFNLDCAALCTAAAALVARWNGGNRPLLRQSLECCAEACAGCARECARHSHEHCVICAAECRACELACRDTVASLMN